MDVTLFPTKGNLIVAKSTLALSRQGYDLLDKKRNILVREMMMLVDRAKGIQNEILITFSDAYSALQTANVTIGISEVTQIGLGVPEENGVVIQDHSIMGVDIPVVTLKDSPLEPTYGFLRTSVALDLARDRFNKVKRLTCEIAEIENAIYRLATNIRRTQKRANALRNIMIPKYEQITADIANALEEKDREEFARLKVIKRTKEKAGA
jgi:V/A-type H+/Na+-transporting ATPase subunit D